MYEWWRFQRYLICPKMLKIKISILLDHTEATRKEDVKKNLSARNCSNIKTAASNLNYISLHVFHFTLVTNLIFRINFVYSFTLNFFILLFPTFCNKLILSPVYSFFPAFCNKWILSLTIFCLRVFGLFSSFGFFLEFWVCFEHSTHTHHDAQRPPHDFLVPSSGFVVEY